MYNLRQSIDNHIYSMWDLCPLIAHALNRRIREPFFPVNRIKGVLQVEGMRWEF